MQLSPTSCHQFCLITYKFEENEKRCFSCLFNHNIPAQMMPWSHKLFWISSMYIFSYCRSLLKCFIRNHTWPREVTLPALHVWPSFITVILTLKSVSKFHWKRWTTTAMASWFRQCEMWHSLEEQHQKKTYFKVNSTEMNSSVNITPAVPSTIKVKIGDKFL